MGGRSQAASDVAAARIRKADIDEYDVRPSFRSESQRVGRIRRANGSMPEKPDELDEELSRIVVVLDDKHAAPGGRIV